MNFSKKKFKLALICFGIFNSPTEFFSQQTKGFKFGILAGAYFANNNTARIYDGYGYSSDKVKNNFETSSLNRKINFEYGGGNGQPDRIAKELAVGTNEWIRITEKDMPINMHYTPAFLIGFLGRYNLNENSSVLFNFHTARISATGNFTIETIPSTNPSGVTWKTENIRTFLITGTEQRFSIQTGLQRYLSRNEIFNFFVEAGPVFNMVKAVNNKAIINSLQVDLTRQYNEYGNEIFRARNMTGVDFGFFAGIGINLNTGSDWGVQILYNPAYERIGIGENPGPFVQHSIGVRMYKAKKEVS